MYLTPEALPLAEVEAQYFAFVCSKNVVCKVYAFKTLERRDSFVLAKKNNTLWAGAEAISIKTASKLALNGYEVVQVF